MTVTIETLTIGERGTRIWIVTRRVGTHLDIEQVPDSVGCEREAHEWAAQRWKVPECDVKFKPVQVIELEE